MERKKRTFEFKLKVVTHFLNTSDGQKRTGTKFGINESNVRNWVNLYKLHGDDGLTHSKQRYSIEKKEFIILYRRENNLSFRQAAEHFNLRCAHSLIIWDRLYENGGKAALERKPNPAKMKKIAAPSPQHNADHNKTQLELIEELTYLRAELDYLKKLNALTQSKNTQQKKKQS